MVCWDFKLIVLHWYNCILSIITDSGETAMEDEKVANEGPQKGKVLLWYRKNRTKEHNYLYEYSNYLTHLLQKSKGEGFLVS